MFVLPFLASFLPLASASLLVSYNASRGDDPSVLGLQNLQGWDRANWPSGQPQNSSLFFQTAKDPHGVPAAHVHKAEHFVRSEYHSLQKKIQPDTTYYIGYRVMFESVDYETIVFQWKNYDGATVPTDNIPAALVFRKNANDANNHTITFGASPDPTTGHGSVVWSKELTMGETYRFGIVINTSQTNGFVQLYFNGKPATMINPANGVHTQKLAGNFYPGAGNSQPKFGLYGGTNIRTGDSYIYNIAIGSTLADIADVAGIKV